MDPRNVLPPCPLDPLFRAIDITCPTFDVKGVNLVSDRKNLRVLLDFVGESVPLNGYRIDAEYINGTVLFFLGWSGNGYQQSYGYGVSFEREFTTSDPVSLKSGTLQHNRVVHYIFGGLKMLVTYQVDAYKVSKTFLEPPPPPPNAAAPITVMTPTDLHVVPLGTLAAPESIVEIKTLRLAKTNALCCRRVMAQMWFSQTPILIAGYHDGNGRFSEVKEMNVMSSGKLSQWESKNKKYLQRLVKLIQMIAAHMRSSESKQAAIILGRGISGLEVNFYSLVDGYKLELPDDLRKKWE